MALNDTNPSPNTHIHLTRNVFEGVYMFKRERERERETALHYLKDLDDILQNRKYMH